SATGAGEPVAGGGPGDGGADDPLLPRPLAGAPAAGRGPARRPARAQPGAALARSLLLGRLRPPGRLAMRLAIRGDAIFKSAVPLTCCNRTLQGGRS